MARRDVWIGIYSALNVSAVTNLLGSQTVTNNRLYVGWPQEQPILSGQEPDEGYVVWHEEPTRKNGAYEDVRVNFTVVTTRPTTADKVIDQMDALWDWRVPQQKAVTYGTRILLTSGRVQTTQEYDEARRLHRRTASYEMEFVDTPYSP